MTELHDLLDRATDRVEARDLARTAPARAHRRRTTRRAVAASIAAAAVVAVVALATALPGRDDSAPPVTPTPTPTSPSISTPGGTQRVLDPRRVDDLPAAPDDLMPLLPEVLDVPSATTALAADPVPAAVLTIEQGGELRLLGVDGRWRRVPLPAATGSVELTRDGTRLLVGRDSAVDIWDLGTGVRTSVPTPQGRQRTDVVTWTWLDDRSLLLDGSWRIDTRTGESDRVREPEGQYVVDDAGEIYEFGWESPLSLLQVRGDTVAGVGWSDRIGSLAVTVADRSDLAPREVLPVRDDQDTTYGNGGLSVQALLPDGTVLLRMLLHPADAEIRFVAWQPATGDLWLVMRTTDTLPGWSVAVDLLG